MIMNNDNTSMNNNTNNDNNNNTLYITNHLHLTFLMLLEKKNLYR